VMKRWQTMPQGDKVFFATILGSLIGWWLVKGRHTYGTKGMRP
jgi:hypothetical protein